MKTKAHKQLKIKETLDKNVRALNLSKKKTSIKFKLIISYVLLAAIPLIIVNTISTLSFKKNLRDTSMKLMTQMVSQTNVNIKYFTTDIEKNVNKFIMSNLNNTTDINLVNEYVSSKDIDRKKAAVQFNQELSRISVFESNIETAVIATENEVIGSKSSVPTAVIDHMKQLEIPSEGIWYTDASAGNDVYYGRNIKNSITGAKFGVLINKIKLNQLSSEMEAIDLFEDARIFIADSDHNILCGSEEGVGESLIAFISGNAEIDSKVIAGKMVAYATGENGWQIVVQIPMSNLTQSVHRLSFIVWLLVILIGITAIFVGYAVSKGFIISITDLVKAMKKTEKGDLTALVEVRGHDEMASLCVSFNNMILNIKELITKTHMVIQSSMESGKVLSESTELTVETFEQLAISIDEITKGSTSQAEDALNSSSVMNDLSESIQKVRHNTQNLFETTENAKSMISGATDSIELLNSTMSSSIKVSDEIKVSIVELGKMTQNIGQIMKFVDGISEQTNLLALNASIEAARAGEVGKGFAVVANEVRNLSEQSKASTSDVRETLGEIEKKSSSTVDLVAKANKIFSEQEIAVQRTYEAFKQIIQHLIDMDKELEYINKQVIDMQKLKDIMSDKIEHITTVTEENASATEEVNALSEEQKEVMEKLSGLSVQLVEEMKALESSVAQFNIY